MATGIDAIAALLKCGSKALTLAAPAARFNGLIALSG